MLDRLRQTYDSVQHRGVKNKALLHLHNQKLRSSFPSPIPSLITYMDRREQHCLGLHRDEGQALLTVRAQVMSHTAVPVHPELQLLLSQFPVHWKT